MSLNLAHIARLIDAHGPVIRVVVGEVRGSAPREPGAAMVVWTDGQDGTIGGGTLELKATKIAREMLLSGEHLRSGRVALGPDMGQCCGGAVTLVSEYFDHARLEALSGKTVFARPVSDSTAPMPLPLRKRLAEARAQGNSPKPTLMQGWMIEPLAPPRTPVWIWGAGHVGRALVAALAPLPDLAITWVDTGPERFPETVPEGVTALPAPEPVRAMLLAPQQAHHLILTYSHTIDLALCDAALRRGFTSAGLIGSDTKWARFRKRLGQMGHTPAAISRIICPIGQKSLGKHPQAIAVGVAHALLSSLTQEDAANGAAGDMGRGNDRRASDA